MIRNVCDRRCDPAVFISEYKWKYKGDDECIAGETEPYAVPVVSMVGKGEIFIDDNAAGEASE